jgi:hypothetical protein
MTDDLQAELLAVLNDAADFVQPFNRAEALLDKIEALIEKVTSQATPARLLERREG